MKKKYVWVHKYRVLYIKGYAGFPWNFNQLKWKRTTSYNNIQFLKQLVA